MVNMWRLIYGASSTTDCHLDALSLDTTTSKRAVPNMEYIESPSTLARRVFIDKRPVHTFYNSAKDDIAHT
ncbi:hypothetical protein BGX21_006724, partial [Mortierella sp. AD011]